jgi:V-type H+-transporting ATPase subunit F
LYKHVTPPPDAQKNFLVVDHKTEASAIEQAFDLFTQERKDIAILLINQHVRVRIASIVPTWHITNFVAAQIADRIRHKVDSYTAAFPSLLEIPSKDHPYDPDKDSVLKRVRKLFGD